MLLTSVISSSRSFPAFALKYTYDGNAEEYAQEYQRVLDKATENGISMKIGNDKETLIAYFAKIAPQPTADISYEVTITDRTDSGPCKFKPAIAGTAQNPDGTDGRAGVRVFIFSSSDQSSSKADALFRINASNYNDEADTKLTNDSTTSTSESNSYSIVTATGTWELKDHQWKYLLSNNKYATAEWCLIDGTWYWFDILGQMATGWIKSHNLWYYLDSSGAMLHDAMTPDGYYVNSDGIWVE